MVHAVGYSVQGAIFPANRHGKVLRPQNDCCQSTTGRSPLIGLIRSGCDRSGLTESYKEIQQKT